MEFVLTDDLGSVRTAITTQAGAATVAGSMGDGPFGFLQYHAGQMGTNKGYTGQYNDPLSGLDYYVARYYDPVVGLFLSADTVQSNLQGFDPYAYVGNNPETLNDPSGQRYTTQAGYNYGAWGGIGPVSTESQAWILPNDTMVINDYLPAPYGIQTQVVTPPQRHIPAYNPLTDPNNSPGAKFAHVTGWDTLHSTLTNPRATTTDKVKAVGAFALKNVNNALQLAMILGDPEFDAAGAGGDGLAALAPTALDKTEVLLDTNAVLNYKRIISAGLLDLSTEEPVISQTVKNELIDIVARKGRYMPGIVDSLRIVPDAGSEETKAALLAFLESLGPVKQQGLAQARSRNSCDSYRHGKTSYYR
jgi:RHS repeat-associated protein